MTGTLDETTADEVEFRIADESVTGLLALSEDMENSGGACGSYSGDGGTPETFY